MTSHELGTLQQRLHIYERLMQLSVQLNANVPLEDLLPRIMDAAAEFTQSDDATVLLWDRNRRELVVAATSSRSSLPIVGKAVPLDNSIAGAIIRGKKPMRVDDVTLDPRHYQTMDKQMSFVTRSLLGVPMLVRDEVIGVLEAVNKRALPWTDDDEFCLSVLAAQAATAIRGAQTVAALRRANEALNQLDNLKNAFIARASHELRTPLGLILGYAAFLEEETRQSPDLHAHSAKVVESAMLLRARLTDLTNLRYLQTENHDASTPSRTPLEQVVRLAYEEARARFESQSVRLNVHLPQSQVLVGVDAPRAVMALAQVLDNAAAFSPEGGRVLLRAEDHPGEIWLLVQDQGPGLPEDALERIFEPFHQHEDHMTRHHEGLGLGLSLARAALSAQGGRMWAESHGVGQGCTFTLALPLAAQPVPDAPPR